MTPKLSRSEVLELVKTHGLDLDSEKVVIVGIRGYYLNTMGKRGVNDRNLYDDAMFVIAAGGRFKAYQANTDPSYFEKGMAVLVPGIYDVVKHRHHGEYAAFQIVRDRLKRDGIAGIDEGRHGINIHYGGIGTWSEGCQTLPKHEFLTDFQPMLYGLMDNFGKRSIKYLLVNGES